MRRRELTLTDKELREEELAATIYGLEQQLRDLMEEGFYFDDEEYIEVEADLWEAQKEYNKLVD